MQMTNNTTFRNLHTFAGSPTLNRGCCKNKMAGKKPALHALYA